MAHHHPLITIAISTVGHNFNRIKWPDAHPDVHILALIQQAKDDWKNHIPSRDDITVATLSSRGLSNSRNAALGLAKTEYLYIADDDLEFDIKAIVEIAHEMKQKNMKGAHAQITHMEGEIRWPEFTGDEIPAQELGKVASCEVFLELDFVQQSKKAFHPDFGVGSNKYPAGEENLFLHALYENGLRLAHFNKIVAHHPGPSSGDRDLGLSGAKGSIRVANTITPRKQDWRRRWKYAIFHPTLSLMEKAKLMFSSTPKVISPRLEDVFDHTHIIHIHPNPNT